MQGLLKLYCLRDDNLRMATTLVRLVGSFGILVSRGKTLSAESRLLLLRIGEFLIGCLTFGSDKVDLIRTAEALDTIFDVFAEDDFNDVIQELGLIEKLRNLEPHFRKQVSVITLDCTNQSTFKLLLKLIFVDSESEASSG